MRVQGARLMAMIGAAMGKLDAIHTLVPILQDLGRRHGGYGVQPQHYDTVGAVSVRTLEQGLGEAFATEVRLAWRQVYGVIADTMQQASRVTDPAVSVTEPA